MEAAARGKLLRWRHHAGNRPQRRPAPCPASHRRRGVEIGPGRKQADRVGMQRPPEEHLGGGLLDDPPRVHHRHVVAGLGDHAEVVGDQQDRGAEASAKVGEQVEDLRLDRHVEGGCRLVGDHEIGLAGQRHRDHHPLPHAPGELVGIFVEPPFGISQPHEREHLERPGPRCLPGTALVQQHRLRHLFSDGKHGVEAGHRLLEDHADSAAADLSQPRLRQRDQVDRAGGRVEQDRPRFDHARRRDQPEDRHRRHALAAATLADQPERAARLDGQRHAVDRRHAAGGRVECGHEIPDVEERHCLTSAPPAAGGRSIPAGPHRSGCRRAP